MPRQTQKPGPESGELIRQRNRLAGLWAAELLGLAGQAAQDYVHALTHHRDGQVDDKLARDLDGHAGMAEIRSRLAHFLEEARQLFQKRT